ncbi:TPA: hypothetical protein ACSPZR_001162 [Aeromonas veronii]
MIEHVLSGRTIYEGHYRQVSYLVQLFCHSIQDYWLVWCRIPRFLYVTSSNLLRRSLAADLFGESKDGSSQSPALWLSYFGFHPVNRESLPTLLKYSKTTQKLPIGEGADLKFIFSDQKAIERLCFDRHVVVLKRYTP